MKMPIEKFIKSICVVFIVLSAALFWETGCATRTPNPLAGWQFSRLDNFDSIPEIAEDYHSYINNLPRKERTNIGPIQFFEDNTGQHAVRMEIALNGTDWAYVLIYNKENKRVKVIKYVAGHYSS